MNYREMIYYMLEEIKDESLMKKIYTFIVHLWKDMKIRGS